MSDPKELAGKNALVTGAASGPKLAMATALAEASATLVSTYSLTIPRRELRPPVRPGTPLARMLRARGMW